MDKGKLQQVRHNDGGVITSPPHGDNPREELGPETGGGIRGMGEGDICGVLILRPEFSGLSSGGVPGEG